MSPAVASLLRRLVSLVAGAAAVNESQAVTRDDLPQHSGDAQDASIQSHSKRIGKLVFGRARHGVPHLASHRSHSSHSSHASHASHYSGTTSSPSYPAAVPAGPPPPPAAVPVRRISAPVLAKLPRIKSRWPAQVRLKQRSYFTIVEKGKSTGIKVASEGTLLPLVEVRPESVVLLFEGSPQPVPFEQCDLVERLGGEAAIIQLPDDPAPGAATVGQATQATPDDDKAILKKLASVRSRWPQNVRLLEKCAFQSFDAGKLTGSKSVEPGAVLRLISVDENGAVVGYDKFLSEVRLPQIDLVEHMGGAAAVLALSDDTEQQAGSIR